ncbi:AraC family transcriptional regulator [Paenibacillus sp. J5C_2022]|uniref:AraC family transcriptional regulator n=1 Tax=Paenibacillus sp. J5C2022 TaxID=2977129 RepID=UPI0021D2EB5B|nr:AraC family transcriptional regulator [Paenibacillus sp. J5C2022]MCU6707921.1 AraC family transcriptional regulator [Paenibacillus sp. J5C2022]
MTVISKEHYFRSSTFPFHIEQYTIGHHERIAHHTHDFIELVFVHSGSAHHEMAGQRYTLQAGDVFIVEPNVYHSYEGSPQEETTIYNVLFDSGFLQAEMGTLLQLPAFARFFYLLPFMRSNASFVPFQPLTEEQRAVIRQHLDTIHHEYMEEREGWQLIVKTRWMECMVWLSRYLPTERLQGQSASPDYDWIGSVCHLIQQQFRQPISLAQVSRMCGMSESSFRAKFKEATGSSLLDYKHAVQIRYACSQLKESNRKVLDIALDSGFNDISFFNKIFRKHCGITPRDYRERG